MKFATRYLTSIFAMFVGLVVLFWLLHLLSGVKGGIGQAASTGASLANGRRWNL